MFQPQSGADALDAGRLAALQLVISRVCSLQRVLVVRSAVVSGWLEAVRLIASAAAASALDSTGVGSRAQRVDLALLPRYRPPYADGASWRCVLTASASLLYPRTAALASSQSRWPVARRLPACLEVGPPARFTARGWREASALRFLGCLANVALCRPSSLRKRAREEREACDAEA